MCQDVDFQKGSSSTLKHGDFSHNFAPAFLFLDASPAIGTVSDVLGSRARSNVSAAFKKKRMGLSHAGTRQMCVVNPRKEMKLDQGKPPASALLHS